MAIWITENFPQNKNKNKKQKQKTNKQTNKQTKQPNKQKQKTNKQKSKRQTNKKRKTKMYVSLIRTFYFYSQNNRFQNNNNNTIITFSCLKKDKKDKEKYSQEYPLHSCVIVNKRGHSRNFILF